MNSQNNNVMPNRSIIIISSKDHPMCKQVIELLKNNEFSKKLQDKFINVLQQDNGGIGDKNIFRIDLYDFNMRLIQSFTDVAKNGLEKSFDQILQVADKLGQPNQNEYKNEQKGGYIDYKQKYNKYKKKYKMLDNVVLGYY